jgi:hypothetical protein
MPDGSSPRGTAATGSAPTLDQLDQQITDLVLKVGQNMVQPLPALTINPAASGNTMNLVPATVGLLKGFLLECTATVSNAGGALATLTEFGPANLLSNITFTDLSNYQRINTTGWHIAMLNTVKRRRPYGVPYTLTSSPIGYGNNFSSLISAPATIANNATGTVKMFYYIPITYSDTDLRGCINLGVTNANAQLQITVNPNPGIAAGDSTLSLYSGSACTITSFTVKPYQHYLDQLPRGKSGGVLIPPKSQSIMYMMINTNLSGMTVGQDFPLPYTNFREFLSTMVIYDNGGTLNAGTDINYLALQAANAYQYYKVDPFVQGLQVRNEVNTDLPTGLYYFNHRHKVLSTQQFGNQSLIMNCSTVNAGAVALIGYEMFGVVNAVLGAQSLPGG